MKKFAVIFALAGMVLLGGCKEEPLDPEPDPKPEPQTTTFNVEVDDEAVTATSAQIVITYENAVKYAYLLEPAETPTDPAVVFATGIEGDLTDGRTVVTLQQLAPVTPYIVYFAAQIDNENYFDEIVEVEFTTTDFSDETTVYDITANSFALHVNLPEETAQRVAAGQTAVRSMTLDLFTYNYHANGFFGMSPDAYILAESGRDDIYPDNVHTTPSFTRLFDEEHVHPSPEGWEYPEEAEYSFYYYPITPGQPSVILMGEFEYREPQYEGDWFGFISYDKYFDEESFYGDYYSGAMEPATGSMFFQYSQEKYWSGYYKRLELVTEQPAKLDAGVNAVSHITPIGGYVEITPEAGVHQYLFTLLNEELFDLVMPYLNYNEDYLQWFVTSYAAFDALIVYTATTPAEVYIDDFFYNITPGQVISLLVVSMGDEYGMTQNYQKFDFTIPESTKAAPELEVSAIKNPYGEESPYEVWFNIKSVGQEPVYSLTYAANDQNSWDALLAFSTYDEVLEYYGNEISGAWYPDQIAAVNSPEGLDVSFWSRDEETTTLAVKAMNDEGVYSQAVWASNTTIADTVPPVESDLYTALEGEWTISVPVESISEDWDDDWNYIVDTVRTTLVDKVTIGNPKLPATLSADVYELYAGYGYDKDATDALYDELKSSLGAFNDKTRSRNRILLNGFPGNVGWDGYLNEELLYASPYDLFVSTNYNGATVNSIVADFGPKWYLQLDADGNVCVPVNYYLNTKLTGWVSSDWYLMVGDVTERMAYAVFDNYGTIEVPVEISADRNTITIKPFVYGGIEYRLGCGMDWGSGYLSYTGITYGDITLTRGWNGGEATAAAAGKSVKKLKEAKTALGKGSVNSIELKRTPLVKGAAAKRTRIDAQPLTPEQFKANVEKHINKTKAQRK